MLAIIFDYGRAIRERPRCVSPAESRFPVSFQRYFENHAPVVSDHFIHFVSKKKQLFGFQPVIDLPRKYRVRSIISLRSLNGF